MKLRFKHQKFQEDATNAICDVFSGQPNETRKFLVDQGESSNMTASLLERTGWANPEIHLREQDLLKNLRDVQKANGIVPNSNVETLTSKVEWGDGRKQNVTRPVFTIEMETGTGKTYTYIKTMYEMNARYGWSKFIIVVPSIAIREGVAKSFQITADHFKEEYGKACRYFIYNSTRLNELEQFADDPGINVMIINSQAFNASGKDARRIYMKLDSFRSRRPIDVIASVNPIVIVDEPQSVIGVTGGKNVTRDSLGKFNPLFYVNYSATHRENFNMVYRLDAVDAYQKQLVKKITVKGISIHGTTATNGYLYLQRINVYPNKSPSATVVIEHNTKSGSGLGKKVKTFVHGDNIYDHSGEIEAYRDGYTIADINAREGYIEFTNGLQIQLGQVIGDSSEEDIRRIQIRETIMSHLEKERELFKKGIKVLSLFFIDEVAKYKYYDESGEQKGIHAQVFEEEYKNAIDLFFSQLPFDEDTDYRTFLERDEPHRIHAGYFSVDKKGRAVDSEIKRGESESADVNAYDLIMKNKERLLSADEPVRFIFSHSALREGWDNPNVFQICTLRMSSGDIKKRQEIGRGLRLSVNKDGERMDAEVLGTHSVHDVNSLTVIANESYEDFARALQDEFYEVIRNRPKEVAPSLFEGQVWSDSAGNELEVDNSKAADIFVALKMAGLVKEGQLTDEYHDLSVELRTEKVSEVLGRIDESLTPYTDNVLQLVESVYNPKVNPIVSDARNKATLNLDHEKFASKQFKELWERINKKTYYTVSFDESKLIDSCVGALNRNLRVSQTLVTITEGYLDSTKQNNPEMKKLVGKQVALEEVAAKNVTFDLIGEIAEPTRLTRKTVATVLQKIEPAVFKLFSVNPEEFIREAVKLIDEQKASTIIEHITYDTLDETWNAEEIFVDTTIGGEYGKNVADAKKHLFDKLRYDSSVEKQLGEDLDTADTVEMYVKLPSGFYINTPMGKYNPDWAIAFKEGSVKHIYFVAETKGDTSDLQLREVERAKIECARRHFSKISDDTVKYSAVASYSELLSKVNA
ncbi:restriction endonuclease [Candidatus Saccharibacteria bacterium RIFCSPHIGHO2_01_FULL_45_15]|nr:MAG: restriction endonuclease [Candidatus Saccharibacteria bacterium RIFCSPHIGHO2_01_FULL_45_15]OGL27117.1 MAG: restriction endonuclease [Candidatus Saccharibacteria bacterium RIFCSPHIGHO2_02_FULL_46_12]OGL31554.1 MAG: restriction endonuclease [Candidatus Saccharibacteria bacterium RIFCSPHIGHO2_12_FULL_44_22]